MSFNLGDIVDRLGGELIGPKNVEVHGVAPLESAGAGEAVFLANGKYRRLLGETGASVVVLGPSDRDATGLPRIVTPKPYLYFARLAQLLQPPERLPPGVAVDAVVGEGCVVPASCSLAAQTSLGRGVRLGERVQIHPGCHIGDEAEIGDDTLLYPGVVVYARCRVGKRCIVHAGAVIGADGFGFAPDGERWEKIPQTGRALIGDDVEVGANTCIDRGAMGDTVVEDGVKLDNLVHIAHNVRVGAHTAMAACVGVAGSARIGRHCMVGGAAGILGHLDVADNVTVSAGTIITRTIREAGTYTATLPVSEHRGALRNAAHYRNLDALARRVAELERQLQERFGNN